MATRDKVQIPKDLASITLGITSGVGTVASIGVAAYLNIEGHPIENILPAGVGIAFLGSTTLSAIRMYYADQRLKLDSFYTNLREAHRARNSLGYNPKGLENLCKGEDGRSLN